MSPRTRRLVRVRAGRRCEYCRFHEDDLPLWPFHLDHIIAANTLARTNRGILRGHVSAAISAKERTSAPLTLIPRKWCACSIRG